VAHRGGVGELGFPPLQIKTDERGKHSGRGLGCRIGAWIKSNPSGSSHPRSGDDAGDRRGRRVPRPELCYAGTEPAVGGGRPSPDLRKQTGRRAGSSPPYLPGVGEVICGTGDF